MLIGGIIAGLVIGLAVGGRLRTSPRSGCAGSRCCSSRSSIRFATEWAIGAGIDIAQTLRLPLFGLSFGLLLAGLWANRDQPGPERWPSSASC